MKVFALVVLVLSLLPDCRGMFIWYETEQVPIGRLFTNLQARLAKDTNDIETTYHLARLHSMAYATNSQTFSVAKKNQEPVFGTPGTDAGVPEVVQPKRANVDRQAALGHLTNAIGLYERTIVLLKKTTNQVFQQWYIMPIHLGYAWCLDQAGRRSDALNAYRKALDIAWKKEVTGDFSVKEWASERWDDVRSGRSPFHTSKGRGSLGPGVVFSSEIIGYMLRLLDPVKDKPEIAELKSREQELSKMGRSITPILVPLQPGLELADCVDVDSTVQFDLDGSGVPRRWGWLTPKAAWLVFDGKGSGQITSALQMFGNVTFWIFWRDGYQALGALDSDGDGVLRGRELDGLALWQDGNSNGVSEPGEVRPVRDYGVCGIPCSGETGAAGMLWNPTGIVFSNGEARATFDWVAREKGEAQITRMGTGE